MVYILLGGLPTDLPLEGTGGYIGGAPTGGAELGLDHYGLMDMGEV